MSHLQLFAETISWAQEVRLSTSRAVLELPHAPGDNRADQMQNSLSPKTSRCSPLAPEQARGRLPELRTDSRIRLSIFDLDRTLLAVLSLTPLALHEVLCSFALAAQTFTRASVARERVDAVLRLLKA